ncbi:MAG: hypothetical protein CSA20_05790 [Deltaproteobacteria bacterium]|nr:MAG: hypothetical protein CSA20_05790 [Deltaproteobacteria bacterium]
MESNQLKTQTRRKIWQVETGYHCSIVGTCLGRSDLRRLKRKKVFGIDSSASDYEIHNVFAGIGDAKTPQSRALQKVLDEKYGQFIKRYAKLHEDEELWRQWQQDSKNDQAPGAFWAIMTHGRASADLIARVYGECHMISFDTFTMQRSSSVALKRMEQRLVKEERKVRQLTDKLQKQQEKSEQLREELRTARSTEQDLEIAVGRLSQQNKDLSAQLSQANWRTELENLRSLCARLEFEKDRLEGALAEARNDANEFRAQIDLQLSQQEYAAEADFVAECESCAGCEDCGTAACVGPDLCGKMVLYVGGRSNMIHLYRQLVEERGGRFSHHDGGRENSRQQLPRLLSGADVVLCPVDCVSHDACKQVKRICKRYDKPFVMMRSSGVSALEKELETVA